MVVTLDQQGQRGFVSTPDLAPRPQLLVLAYIMSAPLPDVKHTMSFVPVEVCVEKKGINRLIHGVA